MTAPVIYLVIPLVLLAACAWLVALLSADQRQARAAARRAERAARPGTAWEDAYAQDLADARAQIRRLKFALADHTGGQNACTCSPVVVCPVCEPYDTRHAA